VKLIDLHRKIFEFPISFNVYYQLEGNLGKCSSISTKVKEHDVRLLTADSGHFESWITDRSVDGPHAEHLGCQKWLASIER
jgi:hypothetical protein